MLYWVRYQRRVYETEYAPGPGKTELVVLCCDFDSHEFFLRSFAPGEVEIPRSCIRKLYPDVKWTDGVRMLWIGK